MLFIVAEGLNTLPFSFFSHYSAHLYLWLTRRSACTRKQNRAVPRDIGEISSEWSAWRKIQMLYRGRNSLSDRIAFLRLEDWWQLWVVEIWSRGKDTKTKATKQASKSRVELLTFRLWIVDTASKPRAIQNIVRKLKYDKWRTHGGLIVFSLPSRASPCEARVALIIIGVQ